MKYSPYSFSKLDVHNQCPRKFKYKYIDKIKVHKDRTALLKGGAVHSILENYPVQSTHKLSQKYQHIVDNFIQTKLAQKYLFRNSTREYSFGLNYDLEPCEYKDKSAIFRGYIDYICIIDELMHLIDWKTGKYREEKWMSYDQLLFYSIYFFKKYPTINEIKISYVYIEHENMENSILLNRKYLNVYIDRLNELINNAENDVSFDKNITKLCDYCDFQELCLSV